MSLLDWDVDHLIKFEKRKNQIDFMRVVSLFSSPEPKAQDELFWSLSVRHPLTPLNDFSSETHGPVFFKLHVVPSVKGGLKIYTNCHGLLSKVAAMPTYGKNS